MSFKLSRLNVGLYRINWKPVPHFFGFGLAAAKLTWLSHFFRSS